MAENAPDREPLAPSHQRLNRGRFSWDPGEADASDTPDLPPHTHTTLSHTASPCRSPPAPTQECGCFWEAPRPLRQSSAPPCPESERRGSGPTGYCARSAARGGRRAPGAASVVAATAPLPSVLAMTSASTVVTAAIFALVPPPAPIRATEARPR